jgi:integrase
METNSVEAATAKTPMRKERSSKGKHGLGHVYQHRSSWWLDVRVRGKRHRLKLGPMKLLEKREARQIADGKINELLMPKPEPEKGTTKFSEFAEKFAAHYVKTRKTWAALDPKSPETTPFQHCARFFGERELRTIASVDVEDFRSHLLTRKVGKRHMKMASANRNVSLLRASFYRAMRNGLMSHNPVAQLPKGEKMKTEAPIATRVLEHEEQPALLEKLPGWLRLLAIFCLQTAARRGDLLKLTWGAVHADHVEFLDTKEGRMRSVTLSDNARVILTALRPPSASLDTFVFEPELPRKTLVSRIRREWRRAVKAAKIPKIRWHDLRHTAITRLVVNGVDLATIKEIAGHSSIQTTQRYLHSNNKLKRQAVGKLSEFGNYLPSALEKPTPEGAKPHVIN